MIKTLTKIIRLLRKNGFRELAQRIGERTGLATFHRETLRDKLPKKDSQVVINGTKIGRKSRYFDNIVPWHSQGNLPNYKSENVNLVEEYVVEGDTVVVIGGGMGITAVAAAQTGGPDSAVEIFEADTERAQILRKTMSVNDLMGRCQIHERSVGEAYSSPSEICSRGPIKPRDLPSCDVLEMYCEGAELEILKRLEIRPRVIITETHVGKEYSPYGSIKSVTEILEGYGYSCEIVDGGWWAENIIIAKKNDVDE